MLPRVSERDAVNAKAQGERALADLERVFGGPPRPKRWPGPAAQDTHARRRDHVYVQGGLRENSHLLYGCRYTPEGCRSRWRSHRRGNRPGQPVPP